MLYSYRYFNDRVVNGDQVKRQSFLKPHAFFSHSCLKLDANDCLVHAVNFALRHPWFTDREQIVRLMQKRCKETIPKAIQQKGSLGVSVSAMKDFFILGSAAYSLSKHMTLRLADGPIVTALRQRVLIDLIGRGKES